MSKAEESIQYVQSVQWEESMGRLITVLAALCKWHDVHFSRRVSKSNLGDWVTLWKIVDGTKPPETSGKDAQKRQSGKLAIQIANELPI